VRVTKEQRLANYRAGELAARQRLDAIREAHDTSLRVLYAAWADDRKRAYRTLAALPLLVGVVAFGVTVAGLLNMAWDARPEPGLMLICALTSFLCFAIVGLIRYRGRKVTPF